MSTPQFEERTTLSASAVQRRGIHTQEEMAAGAVPAKQVIVSVRRKTAVYDGGEDPTHFERGALIVHPVNTRTGDIDFAKVFIIDKDQKVVLSSDSPITIHEPETCDPLEPSNMADIGEVEVQHQWSWNPDMNVVKEPLPLDQEGLVQGDGI